METGRAKAENPPNESVKKIKKTKPAESSSSHSESEHVKLVIKKDELSSSNKTEEEKKPVQTTSGLVKAGNQILHFLTLDNLFLLINGRTV